MGAPHVPAPTRRLAPQFNTACPGLFGTPVEFRKNFEHPILAGRDANATDKQLEKVGGRGELALSFGADTGVGVGRRCFALL